MTPHFFNDDAAVHQESFRLLSEAAEYLGRLPPNALTREMKVKIEAHIKHPSAKGYADRVENIAKDQEWCARVDSGNAFVGESRFTPVGLPVVECLVIRGTVYMQSPLYEEAVARGDTKSAEDFAKKIGCAVAGGMRIELRDAHDVLDKRLLKSWTRSQGRINT